ncbi:hypothetical protein COF68_04450 [Bacillus toyonensis]|uniref:hypothetical protein n=1 Tax=Bacillus toyonensis TaxID=155322 RepID=UPI000BFC7C07|nr:hypothetical protein [Bacillus toyonensis]PHE64106.1 hypothetical protein COF68_04450 [Bacillus toyonensis]
MSKATYDYNYKDTKYMELANGGFLVHVQPKVFTNVLNDIVTMINIETGLDVLDVHDLSYFLPYRKEVSIIKSKLEKDENLDEHTTESKHRKVLDMLKETIEMAIEDGNLGEEDSLLLKEWGISEEDAKHSLVASKEAFKLIFQRNDFTISTDILGMKTDYKFGSGIASSYLYTMDNKQKRRQFDITRERLKSNNSLPINWSTKDFIQVAKGKLLVRLSFADDFPSSLMMNRLISLLNKSDFISEEIVHFSSPEDYAHLNFLCNVEELQHLKELLHVVVEEVNIDKILNSTGSTYLIAEITENFSHENENKEVLCFFMGDRFEDIRHKTELVLD